jgi:hypothetical protein
VAWHPDLCLPYASHMSPHLLSTFVSTQNVSDGPGPKCHKDQGELTDQVRFEAVVAVGGALRATAGSYT